MHHGSEVLSSSVLTSECETLHSLYIVSIFLYIVFLRRLGFLQVFHFSPASPGEWRNVDLINYIKLVSLLLINHYTFYSRYRCRYWHLATCYNSILSVRHITAGSSDISELILFFIFFIELFYLFFKWLNGLEPNNLLSIRLIYVNSEKYCVLIFCCLKNGNYFVQQQLL